MSATAKSLINNKLLLFIVLLNVISFININIFNIYNNISFIGNLVAVLVIIILHNKFNRKDQELIFYLLLFLSYGFLTLIITGGGFGSVITPVFSIITFWVLKRSEFNEKTLGILALVLLAINLYWVMNSPGYYLKFYFNRNDYLNSNTVATILMYTSMYISIFVRRLNWKKSNLIVILVHILSIWGILNCQSRGSLISLLTFIIFDFLIPKRLWKMKKFTVTVSYGIIITGVLFTYIYVRMYINGVQFEVPFINKPLYTGREIIWFNFYEEITQSLTTMLFGLGSATVLWTGDSLNLHNNYLTVLTNLGLVGFLLYYGFWIKQIKNVYKHKKISNYQIRLLLGFLCVLVNGFLEVSMLWQNVFFLNFMFLGLSFDDKDANEDNKIIL